MAHQLAAAVSAESDNRRKCVSALYKRLSVAATEPLTKYVLVAIAIAGETVTLAADNGSVGSGDVK
jgi:hypothetical protein